MTDSQKFLFETCFDGGAPAGPETDGDDTPEAPTFSEAELDQARDEALAAGREQGFREAAASIEQTAALALEQIAKGMEAALQEAERVGEQGEAHALAAAMTVVRKLFPSLAQRHGLDEIEGLIAECLERLRDEPRVAVRVADRLLDPLKARMDCLSERSGFEGRAVLLADEGLSDSDVRVEWADGGAERDSGRLWREIDEILARAFGPAAQDAEPEHAVDAPAPAEDANAAPLPDPAEDANAEPLPEPAEDANAEPLPEPAENEAPTFAQSA